MTMTIWFRLLKNTLSPKNPTRLKLCSDGSGGQNAEPKLTFKNCEMRQPQCDLTAFQCQGESQV